jgi:hypothetical protein
MKVVAPIASATFVAIALAAIPALANHYYGIEPTDNDPPIDVISGVLFGNGSVTGTLAATMPQPNEGFDHVVFYAHLGDTVTVDTIGTNLDPGLAILADTARDGIFVGDAPPNTGDQLTFLFSDDDSGGGLNSRIVFNAPYTGAYLASLAEIDGREMRWTLNVRGSTYIPEPASLVLVAWPLLSIGLIRRRPTTR